MSIVTRHFIVKRDKKIVEEEIDVYSNDDIPEKTEIEFLSKDEIVNDLINRVLSGEDKATINDKSLEELNKITISLGSFIRNTYGLWLTPHPYSNAKNSSADNFAEKISMEIIKNVQKRLAE